MAYSKLTLSSKNIIEHAQRLRFCGVDAYQHGVAERSIRTVSDMEKIIMLQYSGVKLHCIEIHEETVGQDYKACFW